MLVGEPEKALDQLEPLLKIPYFLSPGWLKIDPNFDPLRKNPRFQKLVAGAEVVPPTERLASPARFSQPATEKVPTGTMWGATTLRAFAPATPGVEFGRSGMSRVNPGSLTVPARAKGRI